MCNTINVPPVSFKVEFLVAFVRMNPFVFLQQVRTEVSKVTWPSRKETVTSAVMVFIMVLFAGLFFFIIDKGLSWFVNILLDFGV